MPSRLEYEAALGKRGVVAVPSTIRKRKVCGPFAIDPSDYIADLTDSSLPVLSRVAAATAPPTYSAAATRSSAASNSSASSTCGGVGVGCGSAVVSSVSSVLTPPHRIYPSPSPSCTTPSCTTPTSRAAALPGQLCRHAPCEASAEEEQEQEEEEKNAGARSDSDSNGAHDAFREVLNFMHECSRAGDTIPNYSDRDSVRKKRLTGAAGLLGRLTFSQAELAEREEITLLRETYMQHVRMRISALVTNDVQVAQEERRRQLQGGSQLTVFDKEIVKILFHVMTTYVENHFSRIFPVGVQASGLTPRDVLSIVDALVNINSLFEDDLDTCTFACTPGVRFRVEMVPDGYKSLFHIIQALKTATHHSKVTREELQDLIILHYHDRTTPMCTLVRRIFTLLDCSVELLFGDANISDYISSFYEACCGVERKLRTGSRGPEGSLEALDNTINVDYQKGEVVGRGSFGTVYRCVNVMNGKFLALKELPLKDCRETEQEIRVEIETLKSLNHMNIVKYYGCRFDHERRKVSILMEYAPKSLRDVLLECKGLTLSLISHYSKLILEGLRYLHGKHVIHRDIKSQNVLVTDAGDVKLTDFGSAVLYAEADPDPLQFNPSASEGEAARSSARIGDDDGDRGATDTMTVKVGGNGRVRRRRRNSQPGGGPSPTSSDGEGNGDGDGGGSGNEDDEATQQEQLRRKLKKGKAKRAIVGTPLFLAPEVLKGSLPNESSDMWAFGCLLLELITGKQPWLVEFGGERLPVPLTMYRISQAVRPPQLPADLEVTPEFHDFLYACLALNPNDRPSAKQMLDHPFIRGTRASGGPGAAVTPVAATAGVAVPAGAGAATSAPGGLALSSSMLGSSSRGIAGAGITSSSSSAPSKPSSFTTAHSSNSTLSTAAVHAAMEASEVPEGSEAASPPAPLHVSASHLTRSRGASASPRNTPLPPAQPGGESDGARDVPTPPAQPRSQLPPRPPQPNVVTFNPHTSVVFSDLDDEDGAGSSPANHSSSVSPRHAPLDSGLGDSRVAMMLAETSGLMPIRGAAGAQGGGSSGGGSNGGGGSSGGTRGEVLPPAQQKSASSNNGYSHGGVRMDSNSNYSSSSTAATSRDGGAEGGDRLGNGSGGPQRHYDGGASTLISTLLTDAAWSM